MNTQCDPGYNHCNKSNWMRASSDTSVAYHFDSRLLFFTCLRWNIYSNRNELKEAVDIVDNDFGHNTAFRCTCHSSFTVKSFKYCHYLHWRIDSHKPYIHCQFRINLWLEFTTCHKRFIPWILIKFMGDLFSWMCTLSTV